MKKIITFPQPEFSEYYCDNCGKKAVSDLEWNFGYDSDWDGVGFKLDLCNECSNKLFEELKLKYPKALIQENCSCWEPCD